jgi:hypothetical protein
MPLPPWFDDRPKKDNWTVVSKLRARTEAAIAPDPNAPPMKDIAARVATFVDTHHDF